MNIPHPEILLLIGMAGLYLYDSAILLRSDEGVLMSSLRGRWSIHFGSERLTLRGKEPFFPNPLLPHRPVFQLRWQLEAAGSQATPWTPPLFALYRFLFPLIWVMAAALFVLIPAGLFSRLGNVAVAAGIVLFYTTALLAIGYVWSKREALGLEPRQIGALAFETLTCPPFGLNMARHISRRAVIAEDLLSVARRQLSAADWQQALPEVIKRIDNAIAWEDEGTPRAADLAARQRMLTTELESCQLKKS